MAQLFDFGLLDDEIVKRAKGRARDLQDEWKEVKKRIDAPGAAPDEEKAGEVRKQVRATFDRVETQRAQKKDDFKSVSWVSGFLGGCRMRPSRQEQRSRRPFPSGVPYRHRHEPPQLVPAGSNDR